MSDFIKDCLSGDALFNEVDNYIDIWHEGDSNLELFQFLGMTEKEYELFVTNSNFLPIIVAAHKEGVDSSVIINQTVALAARPEEQSKADKLNK